MRTLLRSLVGTVILASLLGPSAVTVAESAELTPSGAERILPRASVPETIVQDGQGDVWALGDGLMRFSERDGTYALVGDWSLADDAAFATWTMAPARDGGVWLGGPTIRHFDGTRFTEVIEGPPGSVFELLETPDGSLWAVVYDGSELSNAVWRWDGSSWTDMEAGHAIYDLTTDDQGRVWVRTGTYPGPDIEGVAVFDGTAWQAYGVGDDPRLSDADDGSLEDDGALVATEDGLQQIRDGVVTTVWTPADDPPFWTRCCSAATVAETDVWISDLQGIWRCPVPATDAGCRLIDAGLPTVFADARMVMAMAPDDVVWSTGPAGTARLEGERWVLIDDTPGQALTVAPDGTVWVLEAGGVGLTGWRQEGSSWVAERHPSAAPAADAQWLGILPDGTIWALEGGWVRVLARFDGTSWTKELEESVAGRPLEWVEGADVDADGHLWVLWSAPPQDENALPVRETARLDGDAWTVFDVPVAWQERLAAGPGGSIWLGGLDGLYRFTGSAWVQAGFAGSYLLPVDVAADGAVWFTTGSGGLYRMPAP